MTSILKSKRSWMMAPGLFIAAVIVLVITWSLHSYEWIMAHFDNEGVSPVESATIGLLYAVIGFLWFFPTMRSPKARLFWRIDFSLVTLIGICRELDWHKLLVHCTNLPGASHGTHQVCWSIAFIGGTGMVSQICDRMPSRLRKGHGSALTLSTEGLLTVL